jgi:hypothetical protein
MACTPNAGGSSINSGYDPVTDRLYAGWNLDCDTPGTGGCSFCASGTLYQWNAANNSWVELLDGCVSCVSTEISCGTDNDLWTIYTPAGIKTMFGTGKYIWSVTVWPGSCDANGQPAPTGRSFGTSMLDYTID